MYLTFAMLIGLFFSVDTTYVKFRWPYLLLENRQSVKVPKSIFVVPLLERCSNGYVYHEEKGCLRLISVNKQAETQNLLRRLNHAFVGYRQKLNEQEKKQKNQAYEQERQQQQQNNEEHQLQPEKEYQHQKETEQQVKEQTENKEQQQREKQDKTEKQGQKEKEQSEKMKMEPQQKEEENRGKEQQQNEKKCQQQKNQPVKEQQQVTDIEQKDGDKKEELQKKTEQQQHDEKEEKMKNELESESNLLQLSTQPTLSQYYQYTIHPVRTEERFDFVGITKNSKPILVKVAPTTFVSYEHKTTTMNFPLRIQIPLQRRNRRKKNDPTNI